VKDKPYEILEHTADIRIRIKGKDLADLFQNAGLALFEISSRRQYVKDKKHVNLNLRVEAQTQDELLVNWLNELIFQAATKGLIFHNLKISKLTQSSLEAKATGSSSENYKILTEIKAATYHELKLEQVKEGWQAEVILDV
jgi:SHS2 domain-containing protein